MTKTKPPKISTRKFGWFCPSCNKKAVAKADYNKKEARLYCESYGYNKHLPKHRFLV